jgi:hypothetical protein
MKDVASLAVKIESHPGDESETLESVRQIGSWPVNTPGGRFHAEWDPGGPVSREGQLIFFFQFLAAGARWSEFLKDCPLSYRGGRGSGAENVLGTAMLSILSGHWRYAHINGVRGDTLNAGLLGMTKTVSEDTVRLGLQRIEPQEGLRWLRRHILASISPVLHLAWVLDIDTTVKTLYGYQEGAEIGYNPHKPGRASHVYHSYFVAKLRVSLGVEVMPGKSHSSKEGLPGLWAILEELPRSQWPMFIRGDCGYGNEGILTQCEERGLPYLFKLKHTMKVKSLVRVAMQEQGRWLEAGAGWEAMEATLKLAGWSRRRRVVLVRETVARVESTRRRGRRGPGQEQRLPGTEAEEWQAQATPWSGKISVLVTNTEGPDFTTEKMPFHYRQRADAENAFDELKNQWGWNGFTTRKLGPCRLMANFIALIYNWWHLYARFYDEAHHREAITSRPTLMQGVARQVRSGGQNTVRISILHERGDAVAKAVALISQEIHRLSLNTEQLNPLQRWTVLLDRVLRHFLGGKRLPGFPEEVLLKLSG